MHPDSVQLATPFNSSGKHAASVRFGVKCDVSPCVLIGSQMLSLGSKAKKAAIVRKREMASEVLAEKQRIRAEKSYAKDAAKVRQNLLHFMPV